MNSLIGCHRSRYSQTCAVPAQEKHRPASTPTCGTQTDPQTENDEGHSRVGGSSRRSRKSCAILIAFYALIVALYLCSTASAKPTQQDVFRSIENNTADTNESGGRIILFICAGAALLIVLAYVSKRQQRQSKPTILHHHGKLLKEIRSAIGLKTAELKQLRIAADESTLATGEPFSSPLVLMLCPSALAQATRNPKTRVDRTTIARMIKRLVKG
ncbi:MAG TPA: hypothetical protein VH370_11675 [Humisphaera sp.]|nr:hypothetical protein [Humisphaera sp.]